MEQEILAGLKKRKNKLLKKLAIVLSDIDEVTEDIINKRQYARHIT